MVENQVIFDDISHKIKCIKITPVALKHPGKVGLILSDIFLYEPY